MAKMGLGKGLDLLLPKDKAAAEKKALNTKVIESPEKIESEEVTPDVSAGLQEETPAADDNSRGDYISKDEEEASLGLLRQLMTDGPDLSVIGGGATSPAAGKATDDGESIVTLRISRVEPNKDQSRKTFDENSLEELAQSIRQYGIIQPIVVCKKGDFYEIIAGERRWRAAKKAGLTEIPVVIRNYEDKERAEVSLIENIQRENLNPIEEAAAYKQLIDEYDLTQETLASRVSKSRTAIANMMRLLKLSAEVQAMVVDGRLSGGHARALLGIEDEAEQVKAAQKVIDNNLNVRQTEDLVKELNRPDKKPAVKKKTGTVPTAVFKDLENRMTEVLGTKVKIAHQPKGNGKIEINYFSEFELDRIYKIINSSNADL